MHDQIKEARRVGLGSVGWPAVAARMTLAALLVTAAGSGLGNRLSAQAAASTAPSTVAADLRTGQQLLGQQKFDEAAEVFGALTTAQPGHGQAWFLQGYALHAAGRLDEALKAHLQAVVLRFNVAGSSYNAACAYALKGETVLALEWLERAWVAGFADVNGLSTDPDLSSVRGHERFKALQAAMGETVSGQSLALGEITTLGDAMPGIGGGIVVDAEGSIFVADFLTTLYKQLPSGEREVFASGIPVPSGIGLDSQGRVYQSAFKAGEVLRFSPSGDTREVLATGIPDPVGIVLDAEDRVFVTSCKTSSIYTISPAGSLRLLVQDPLLQCPNGITRDEQGNLYVCNFNDGMVLRISPEGEVSPLANIPGGNNGHITYRHGFLWVAAMSAHQLYRLSLDGELRLIAGVGGAGGQDGPGLQATLFKPNAMAFDPEGTTLYWNGQRGYLADPASKQASIVRGLELGQNALQEEQQREASGAGEMSTLGDPIQGGTGGLALAADGSVLMADFVSTLYRVTPAGEMSVFASGIQTPSGLAVDPDGRVYQAALNGNNLLRFEADGTRREVVASGIPGPVGVAMGAEGEVFVTSCNANAIYRLDRDGSLSRFAQSPLLQCPNGLVQDDEGNLYTCNFNDGWVLRISAEGEVSPLANIPGGNNGHITYRSGSLYVAGKASPRLYRLSLEGSLTALAGTGRKGAVDGPALGASMMRPNGLVFSADGLSLYVNDHQGDAVNAYAAGPSVLRRLTLPEGVHAAR